MSSLTPPLQNVQILWRTLLWIGVVQTLVQLETAAPLPAQNQWPNWRGPLHTGVAPLANPPIEWSESRNVRWKLPLPGKGHSTPIAWGDHLYLTAAIPVGDARPPVYDEAPGTHDNVGVTHNHQFAVLAVRRSDGAVRWQKVLREEFPHEGGHNTGSLASQSPVTDGNRLYVFMGSRGLHCLDMDGAVLWQKDLGRMNTLHAHGEGSSPALHGDTLVINWDHEGSSALYAFDKTTGETRWKVARDEMTSWSTPLIVEVDGKPQVVVSATRRVRGYELATGKLLWECSGLSRNVVSSPVAGHGLVFAANSYDWQAMLAIRLSGATGNITSTPQVAWSLNRLTPYVSTPLLYDDALYFIRHNQNVLSVYNAREGRPFVEPIRLPDIRDIFASPLGAGGRVYIASRDGSTVVLQHGRSPKVIGVNRLDDVFSASPIAVERDLYLRGERFLYCLAEPGPTSSPPAKVSAPTSTPPSPPPKP